MKALKIKKSSMTDADFSSLGEWLKNGKIGVIPTDTIYGVVTSAFSKEAVENLYLVRARIPEKPFIIIIGSIDDLNNFSINLTPKIEKQLNKFWPGKVSIILECYDQRLEYLHRGTNSLGFRLPDNIFLQKLLASSGPIVAPSANTEGNPSSKTIEEAKKYFGDKIDFYVDAGEINGQPSKIIKLVNEEVEILR